MSLAPFVFLVHDLEETWQVERMNAIAQDMARRLPEPIGRRLRNLHYTRRAMGGMTAALFAVQVALTLWSRHSRRGERALSAALAVRCANGVMHLGESIALRRYVPGAATSPAIMAAAALARRSLKSGGTARLG